MMKVIPKRACVGLQRITKRYFLSILPTYPDPTYILEASTGQKIRIDSINTKEKPLDLKNGLYKHKYIPIENSYPRKILVGLRDDEWSINSFNPLTREICFSIKDLKFSYTIPDYFWK